MDADRFDNLARGISGAASRRVLLGSAAGVILATSGGSELAAKPRRRRRHHRKSRCGKHNCDGCCTSEKTCVPVSSLSEFACGLNGELCEPCSDGLDCLRDQGTCECTTSSCMGCCTADLTECNTGVDHVACGTNGDFCQNCEIQGLVCGAQQTCCIACGVACCAGGERCVLPWNGAPQDQHCCPNDRVCVNSQTGCCSDGLTCVPRVNPPAGTPTYACVT